MVVPGDDDYGRMTSKLPGEEEEYEYVVPEQKQDRVAVERVAPTVSVSHPAEQMDSLVTEHRLRYNMPSDCIKPQAALHATNILNCLPDFAVPTAANATTLHSLKCEPVQGAQSVHFIRITFTDLEVTRLIPFKMSSHTYNKCSRNKKTQHIVQRAQLIKKDCRNSFLQFAGEDANTLSGCSICLCCYCMVAFRVLGLMLVRLVSSFQTRFKTSVATPSVCAS